MKFRKKVVGNIEVTEIFSGIRDKNNKDIYENDIILFKYGQNILSQNIGIVDFNLESGRIEFKQGIYRSPLIDLIIVKAEREDLGHRYLYKIKDESLLEIIGNEIDTTGLCDKLSNELKIKKLKYEDGYNKFVIKKLKEFNSKKWFKRLFGKFNPPSYFDYDRGNF